MRRRIFLTPLLDVPQAFNPADLCTGVHVPSMIIVHGGVTTRRPSLSWWDHSVPLCPVVRLGESREDLFRVFDEILDTRKSELIPGLPGISPFLADMLRTEPARELIRPLITYNRRKE